MPWVIAASAAVSLVSVYCIYYYLLRNDSGNSQDYPTSSSILDFLRLFVRREAVNLGSFLFALVGQVEILWALLVLGGVISCAVLVPQHVQLRSRVAGGRV
jgi:hypothetical protein